MSAGKNVVRMVPKSAPDRHKDLYIMDAIFPTKTDSDRYALIDRDKIEPNPFQPRRIFDPEIIKALGLSMLEQGQLQSILVRPHPVKAGKYQLVTGERRWRASEPNADFKGVPLLASVIRDVPDAEMGQLAVLENIHRVDLTLAETVNAVHRMSRGGFTQIQIDAYFKQGRGWAYKHLKAADAGDDLKWLLEHPKTLSLLICADKVKDERLRYKMNDWIKGRFKRNEGVSEQQLKDWLAAEKIPKAQPRETAPSWGIKATPEPEVTPRPDTSNDATNDNNGITTSRHFLAQPEKVVQTTIFDEPRSGPLIESADVPRHYNAPKLEPETVGNLPDKCLEGLTTFIAEFQAMDARGDWAIERKIEWRDTLERIMASAQFARDMIEL